MDKFLQLISKWGLTITIILLIFINLSNRNNKVKDNKRDDKFTAMNIVIDEIAKKDCLSKKEIKDLMQEVMLDFLISEDELDKKLITISEIKKRIDND